MNNIELGSLSRKLINGIPNEELSCPAPIPYMDKEKYTILFIGLNPSGDERDADRDRKTNSLL